MDVHKWVDRVEWEPEHDKPGNKKCLNEIVIGPTDMVHIERMDDGFFWMAVYKGDQRQMFSFTAAGLVLCGTEAE